MLAVAWTGLESASPPGQATPSQFRRTNTSVEALPGEDQPGFVLAELNDLLSSLTAGELCSAVEHADLAGLTPYLGNYVAAMVELAAHQQDVPPPSWVRDVEPLPAPRFATPLAGLRLHLLRRHPDGPRSRPARANGRRAARADRAGGPARP